MQYLIHLCVDIQRQIQIYSYIDIAIDALIQNREREGGWKIAISKPHGKGKPNFYNRYTHTHTHTQRESNPNTIQKIVIKSQEKRTKETKEKRPTKTNKTINKMVIITYRLVITLNENELNAPTKRHRLA